MLTLPLKLEYIDQFALIIIIIRGNYIKRPGV
jgi:hypothetical protein